MKLIISINLPVGATENDAFWAVKTALADYVGVRRNPEEYVAKRYATHDAGFRSRKLESVKQAVSIIAAAQVDVVRSNRTGLVYDEPLAEALPDGKYGEGW